MVRRGRGLTRARLLAGCCCAAVALGAAGASAQVLLDPSGTQVSAGGQAPVITPQGRTTDITLGASRTILSWSSFNLTSDQSVAFRFQDRSWIVLNRVTGQAVIDGQIEALVGAQRGAGNVWFAAPGGVIFGPNARVNVGGLLATPGTIAASAFLNTSSNSFSFTGAGAGRVEMRGGAELRTGGGTVALIAGAVATQDGATITGPGTALYGAANDFTVRFAALPGDLDLLDFVVPAGGGTASATPLSLAGQTAAGHVFLAVVNRAEVASAVISAPGVIAAQSASTDRGDVILTAGVDILNRQPGATRTNATTETTASFGAVIAQRDLLGGFGSPTAVSAAQLAAGRDLGITAASLDVGALNAGRVLVVDASRGITVRGGASAGGAATFRTTGALVVGGGSGSINAIGRLQLDVGSVSAGQLNSGRSVVVNASGVGANNGPAVNIAAALAEDDILITATNAGGSIVLGQATLTDARTDEAPAGRILSLIARGAQGDVTYGGTAGALTPGVTNLILQAGRDVTVTVPGLLTLNSGSAGRNFLIRAQDLDLAGPVTAGNLRIEALLGRVTLGGGGTTGSTLPGAPLAAGDEGLRLTDAEFQRITVADTVGIYAGAANGTARGNMVVQDLTVNPTRTPRVVLGAGPDNDVLITGMVAPGVGGGVLAVGDTANGGAFQPGRIIVTGSIGFATGSPNAGFNGVRGFDRVTLNARRDVLVGTQRFVDLVAATPPGQIDIGRDQPAGVAPTDAERDRVFVTAGEIRFAANDRIVQQNTGTTAQPNGILVTAQQAGTGGAAVTVTPAQVVDLFGAFRGADGGGPGGFFIDGQPTPDIRFNGCIASEGGCAAVASPQKAFQITTLEQIRNPSPDSDSGSADGDGGVAAALSMIPPEPVVLSFSQPEGDTFITDPVPLGTGSAEIWKKKRGRK